MKIHGDDNSQIQQELIFFGKLILHEAFFNSSSDLPIALGKDITGKPIVVGLEEIPFLLLGGLTGTGKSNAIRNIITSIAFKHRFTPEKVKFILIDPKRIELPSYEGIPHLLHPVIVDPRIGDRALAWAAQENERRIKLLYDAEVHDISSYNKTTKDKLHNIVIAIDEFSDLMCDTPKTTEESFVRLTQEDGRTGTNLPKTM